MSAMLEPTQSALFLCQEWTSVNSKTLHMFFIRVCSYRFLWFLGFFLLLNFEWNVSLYEACGVFQWNEKQIDKQNRNHSSETQGFFELTFLKCITRIYSKVTQHYRVRTRKWAAAWLTTHNHNLVKVAGVRAIPPEGRSGLMIASVTELQALSAED